MPADPAFVIEQAGGTLRDLLLSFYSFLPRIVLALPLFGLAWVFVKLTRLSVRAALGEWARRDAVSAMSSIAIYMTAAVIALSVLAGDARALLGSVGLIGLALSWALQTPIESFTGWFLNSLRGYYRVGDRIEVGDVFGDVYKIDVLTTTVWEAGGPADPAHGGRIIMAYPRTEVRIRRMWQAIAPKPD
jgi:small-conductance mechanosensitive channel